MTEQQKRFAEYYASEPNATASAIKAGYSKKSARSQGQRLLTNDDILDYIQELQEQPEELRIASLREVKAFWSEIMNDDEQKVSDRLKASELLAKSAGAFAEQNFADGEKTGRDDDVVIVMPYTERDDPNFLNDEESELWKNEEVI